MKKYNMMIFFNFEKEKPYINGFQDEVAPLET